MRKLGLSVLSLLACAFVVLGQAGAPPVPQENLDGVLAAWEKSMTDLRSFAVEIERTSFDKVLNTRDVFTGHAMFMKATGKNDGSRARLELYKKDNTKIFEKYICTGTFLYEYSPVNNKVRVHNMPQNNKLGGKPQDMQQESFLSFLFGMGAAQAKARYEMEIKVPNDATAAYYHYILVKPRTPQDKTDFTEARLSLLRSNKLPAQIWYHQANGNEITWNFSKMQIDVQIPKTYFEPEFPKGWEVQRVMPNEVPAAPVVRNKPQ